MNKKHIQNTISGALLITLLATALELLSGGTLSSSKFLWIWLSNILIVTILGYYIVNNVKSGWKLSLLVFIIYFIIGTFNLLIEAYIFDVTNRQVTLKETFTGLVIAVVIAPILVMLFNKWKPENKSLSLISRSHLQWLWRIISADFLYLFFYLTAGFILQAVYPRLLEFYSDKIPPFDIMIGTQFFRGLLFSAVAIIISRTLDLSLSKKAIFTGILFVILGGISQLIPPSEHMPQYIRLAHGIEVGISNLLYGIVLGFLLGQKNKQLNQ